MAVINPPTLIRRGQRLPPVFGGGGGVVADALGDKLASLEAASKLVCAWYLPASNPARDLTLVSTAVQGWAAAYGTQKVNLAELTTPPTWDATLFSNKGGVVFDGTDDCLTGTGNVTNWPDNTADLYMLAGVRNDATASIRRAFSYGDTATTTRALGSSANTAISAIAGSTAITGASVLAGAHTIGVFFDIGSNSAVYLDGVSDGTAATASANLTRTRVRLGASAIGTPTQFFQGAIVCAAILHSTATLTDFTDLEALMRARLS